MSRVSVRNAERRRVDQGSRSGGLVDLVNVGTTNADLAPWCGQTSFMRALLDYADDPNSGVFTTEDTLVMVACH